MENLNLLQKFLVCVAGICALLALIIDIKFGREIKKDDDDFSGMA